MRKLGRAAVAAAVSLFLTASELAGGSLPSLAQTQPTAAIESGSIQGAYIGTGIEYLGIPYANPPIGSLRWRPPVPADPWPGIRDATQFGPMCPQFNTPAGNLVTNVVQGQVPVGSEDCLYLNVWTPAPSGDQPWPVLVFFHGGGNRQGSADRFDGSALANTNHVVVVTVDYRVGVFGFLAHPGLSAEDPVHPVSGNYGLLDQIRALQWVHDNIGAFNGDAHSVTIGGESAGAYDVELLLTSPLAAGLFQRAIIESAWPDLTDLTDAQSGGANPVSGEAKGVTFATALGCTTPGQELTCLRSKSTNELLQSLPQGPAAGLTPGTVYFTPVIDGWVVTGRPPQVVMTGHYNHVPVIIGTNNDEATLFMPGIPLNNARDYVAAIRERFPNQANQLLAAYPLSNYASPYYAYDAADTDATFTCPSRRLADALAASQANVYVYRFTHVLSAGPNPSLGAFHSEELNFLFRFDLAQARSWQPDADEQMLADTLTGYWTDFARAGDPNSADRFPWAQYTLPSRPYLILDWPPSSGTRYGLSAACV